MPDRPLPTQSSYHAPAEPGQIREDEWRRWYVGTGDRDFMCRYETIAGNIDPQLLPLPAYLFTEGKVGRPVGRWTGTLLEPVREP